LRRDSQRQSTVSLRSGMLAQGAEVVAAEQAFLVGLDHVCVAVNPGTSGLHLSLSHEQPVVRFFASTSSRHSAWEDPWLRGPVAEVQTARRWRWSFRIVLVARIVAKTSARRNRSVARLWSNAATTRSAPLPSTTAASTH